MSTNAFLVILLSFLNVVFGTMPITETSVDDKKVSFENLPVHAITVVASYLDDPFESLATLSKTFNNIMPEVKKMQLSRSKFFIKNPVFEYNEWSPEINKLLHFNPVILSHFFNDFVVSKHIFKVINKEILNHFMHNIISLRFDYNLNLLLGEILARLLNDGKYDFIESLFIICEERSNEFNFQIYKSLPPEFVQYLYRKNKNLFKVIFKFHDTLFFPMTISWLFNFKDLTYDDLFGFFDFVPIKARLQGMMISVIENEFEVTCPEDKKIILMRNQKIIDTLLENGSFSNESESRLLIMTNLARYSDDSNSSEIIEKYLNKKLALSSLEIRDIARAAFLGRNVDLFRVSLNLLNDKNILLNLYSTLSRSKKLVQFFSDEDLMKYCYLRKGSLVDPFGSLLELEAVARIEPELRSLEDLKRLYIVDDLGKLIALAFYYPLNYFIEELFKMPEMIQSFMNNCESCSRKIRNNLNNSAEIVYEILKLIPYFSINTPNLNEMKETVLGHCQSLHIFKMIVESKNDLMISFICSNIHYLRIRVIFDEINTDPKFKRNLMRPEVHALRSKLVLDWRSLESLNLLAHELVELLRVLGLEIGNFDFEPLASVRRLIPITIDEISRKTVDELKTVQIDKLLVMLALETFNRQKRTTFDTVMRGNPMLLSSFGIFQLWWERNPITFELFAPSKVVDAFRKRII